MVRDLRGEADLRPCSSRDAPKAVENAAKLNQMTNDVPEDSVAPCAHNLNQPLPTHTTPGGDNDPLETEFQDAINKQQENTSPIPFCPIEERVKELDKNFVLVEALENPRALPRLEQELQTPQPTLLKISCSTGERLLGVVLDDLRFSEKVKTLNAVAALKALDHPNLESLVKASEKIELSLDREKSVVLFKFIDGETLQDMMSSGRRLNADQVRSLLKDITSAIRYLHDKDCHPGNHKEITHNAICPNNIVLDRNGRWHLCGFQEALFDNARAVPTHGPHLRYQSTALHGAKKDLRALAATALTGYLGAFPEPLDNSTNYRIPSNIGLPKEIIEALNFMISFGAEADATSFRVGNLFKKQKSANTLCETITNYLGTKSELPIGASTNSTPLTTPDKPTASWREWLFNVLWRQPSGSLGTKETEAKKLSGRSVHQQTAPDRSKSFWERKANQRLVAKRDIEALADALVMEGRACRNEKQREAWAESILLAISPDYRKRYLQRDSIEDKSQEAPATARKTVRKLFDEGRGKHLRLEDGEALATALLVRGIGIIQAASEMFLYAPSWRRDESSESIYKAIGANIISPEDADFRYNSVTRPTYAVCGPDLFKNKQNLERFSEEAREALEQYRLQLNEWKNERPNLQGEIDMVLQHATTESLKKLEALRTRLEQIREPREPQISDILIRHLLDDHIEHLFRHVFQGQRVQSESPLFVNGALESNILVRYEDSFHQINTYNHLYWGTSTRESRRYEKNFWGYHQLTWMHLAEIGRLAFGSGGLGVTTDLMGITSLHYKASINDLSAASLRAANEFLALQSSSSPQRIRPDDDITDPLHRPTELLNALPPCIRDAVTRGDAALCGEAIRCYFDMSKARFINVVAFSNSCFNEIREALNALTKAEKAELNLTISLECANGGTPQELVTRARFELLGGVYSGDRFYLPDKFIERVLSRSLVCHGLNEAQYVSTIDLILGEIDQMCTCGYTIDEGSMQELLHLVRKLPLETKTALIASPWDASAGHRPRSLF